MIKVPVINNNLKSSVSDQVQQITYRFYLVDTLGGMQDT